MKVQIKRWWDARVLFDADVPDNIEERFRTRFAVELAVRERVNLSGSNLRGSNLSGSDLSGSNLRDSDLSGSDLRGSDLSGSDLQPIRDDIWAVLSSAPAEVPALIAALKNGRVDGSTYTGECACLVGTIANARGTDCDNLGSLKPSSSRPAERFFMGIKKGDKPETNQLSALALEWAEEWLSTMRAAFCAETDRPPR